MKADVSESKMTYRCWTEVSLRYGDTDALGHINNAVFATLFESGRANVIFNGIDAISEPGTTFVLANLNIAFRAEMHFPGTVEVGTRLLSLGRTSFTLGQALFKDGTCCALSEDVIVLIDNETRRPVPISERLRAVIEERAGGVT